MSAPAVSVLVTVYNRERYLAESLQSVLAQTFQDFEIVIVDNCSTDGSLEVARVYEARDPRVRVFLNERNLGQFGNRNRAASHARGRYLKFHDSDDLMYPHCLEVMVSMLEQSPTAGFALSSGWAWDGGPCPMVVTPRQAYQREFLGFGMFMAGPSGALFRASTFQQLGGFVDHGAPSDHIFWLNACARETVALLPADLFWYRTHPGQELQSAKALRDYAQLDGHRWRAVNADSCPLGPDEVERARQRVAFDLGKLLWRDLRSGRFGLAASRFRASGLGLPAFLSYCRRPTVDALAGTPLTSNGEYLGPSWLGASDQLPPRQP